MTTKYLAYNIIRDISYQIHHRLQCL